MKNNFKKGFLVNMMLVLSLSSATVPVFAAAGTGPSGLSSEYELTSDGYIITNEVSSEEIENMTAINDPEVLAQKEQEELAELAEQTASQRTYYTMIDHGTPARLST